VFFDHFGPVTRPPEADSDVGGHPHIGLATVTYHFEGSFMHRHSLGTVQVIRPGAINWTTAGSGVVHSDRVPDARARRHAGSSAAAERQAGRPIARQGAAAALAQWNKQTWLRHQRW
jgi:redox-sensitive bicupin YhaK (pirin superfamily)